MNKFYSKFLFVTAISTLSFQLLSNEIPKELSTPFASGNSQLVFTENKGQVHDQNNNLRPDVLFSGMTNGMVYHLRNNGVSYQLNRIDTWKTLAELEGRVSSKNEKLNTKVPDKTTIYRLDLNWKNINSNIQIIKLNELSEESNYYLGSNSNETENVHSYTGIIYRNIYSNIDLHYYQKDKSLKYDFIVKPFADYKKIKLEVNGATAIKIQSDNSLVIKTPLGDIQEGAPIVFQEGKQLNAAWKVEGDLLSFEIENYNPSKELIIDPATRVWGTYYGGTGNEFGQATTLDATGNVYLAGYTNSSLGTIIATAGSNQTTFGGGTNDAFLAKFNSSGVRQWATYYGGNGNDFGYACKADGSGNIYLTGYTSTGTSVLIASAGSHQTAYGGGTSDAFLAKFNSAGVRQWGTYYGGTGGDIAYACSVDGVGNIYISGYSSTNTGTVIASTGSHQTTMGGGFDAFLAKFNTVGVRQWGTYYGGTGGEYAYGCAVDASNNVFITGFTNSSNGTVIATASSHQPIFGGGDDAFLVKFNSSGVRQWGTYYGDGTGNDYGYSCAVDISGNIYMTGLTNSSTGTVIATAASHQPLYSSNYDGFLVKFSTSGIRQWGTYYGDAGYDEAQACATDGSGNVYIAGLSSTFIGNAIASAGSYQQANGGGNDAFLAKFTSTGSRLWGTYYGGVGGDVGYSCVAEVNDYVYLSGRSNTTASGVIASSGSHQSTNGGNDDAFLVKFCNVPNAPTNLTPPSNQTLCANSTTTLYANGTGAINWFNVPTGGTPITSGTVLVTPTLSAGNYTYYVEATTCTVSAIRTPITVSVSAFPIITVNSGTICRGSSFTMTPSGATTYTFQGGSAVVSPTVNSTYTVTGSSAFGCKSLTFATASVTVNSNPTITVNSGTVCSGKSFTMNPSGAISYTFQGGNAVVTPTTNSTYTVIGSNAAGCVSQTFATSSVTVVANPTITVSNGTICSGNSYTIIPSGAVSYTYQGGSAVVSPTTNSTYTVIGASAVGCISNIATSNVVVNALPLVNAVTSLSVICAGQNVNITAMGAITYTWNTGATTTVIAVSPTVTTTYTVTGTDANGCRKSATESVTVNALPNVTAVSSPSMICIGQNATVTANGATTYTWNTGSNAVSIAVSPTTSTSYSVTGTDGNGCSKLATIVVTVNPLPNISINPSSAAVCLGSSTTMTANGALTYTWSTGANTAAVVLSPTINSTYTVNGTDINNCVNMAMVSITVNPLPTVNAFATNTLVCSGDSTTLSASGANTYVWSHGPTTSTSVVNPISSVTYTVIGTDANNCSNSALTSVSVNPLPVLNTSSSSSLICSGQTSTLTTSGALTFTWSTSANGNSIVVSPTVTTTYTVSGTDANGCVNNDTISQLVSPCTGLTSIKEKVMSKVYPNPSQGLFNLDIEHATIVKIHDVFGKIIYSSNLESGVHVLDINAFANGLYLLNLEYDNKIEIRKLIKE